MYCVGGSLKNLCHFEMGGGDLANANVIRGSLNADRGKGGKICQNLADVICERSLSGYYTITIKNNFYLIIFRLVISWCSIGSGVGLNINYTRNYFKNIPVNGYSIIRNWGEINPKSNFTQLKFLLSSALRNETLSGF